MGEIKEIYFHKPRVEGNRVIFSWEPNYIFKNNEFWIEYPDFDSISCSEDMLAEAYAPICFALGALGEVDIHLPVYIDADVLTNWQSIIGLLSQKIFKNHADVRFVNAKEGGRKPPRLPGDKTAILFGGGIESLAVLSRLRRESSPYCLISIGGSNWAGSDPELNKDKFEMDKMISQELKIPLINIRTNFRELIENSSWRNFLQKGASAINSVLFLPFMVASVIPVASLLGIHRVISGNEKENDCTIGLFSFSKDFTDKIKNMTSSFKYESMFSDLWKVEIVKELYTKNKDLVKYQYSCWQNKGQRWCYRCEKCFRNYIFLKLYDIDPRIVDFNEKLLFSNVNHWLWRVRTDIVSDMYKYKEYGEIKKAAMLAGKTEVLQILKKVYRFFYLRKILGLFLPLYR